jgi:2'-5' RNA ligase
MEQYAVVYFPKNDLKQIQDFRKKYDPQWEIIDPHITLVFPFSDLPEEAIINHVENIVGTIKPFEIQLKGLMKSFDHCLFLLVQEGKEHIMGLHDQLYKDSFTSYLRADIPFVPHMTIGYFATKEDQLKKDLYEKGLAEATAINFDIICQFDNISLIKGDAITPAKIVRTFTLH